MQDSVFAVGPDALAAELAEESFYQYERILQQEAQPSLFVELPRTQEDMEINPALAAALGAFREVKLSIKYRARQPACGLRFSGHYAFTDMQVSSWPCLESPIQHIVCQHPSFEGKGCCLLGESFLDSVAGSLIINGMATCHVCRKLLPYICSSQPCHRGAWPVCIARGLCSRAVCVMMHWPCIRCGLQVQAILRH